MSANFTIAACAERILDAALKEFKEYGYNASIDAVATRAGVARQTIYNHFGSKEALFGAALERAIKALFSSVRSDDDDLRGRLIRFGLELRARALDPEVIKLQRVLINEAPRFPELANGFFTHCFLGAYEQLAPVFAEAMEDGRLRRDDPIEAARLFMEMMVGLDRSRMLFGGSAPEGSGEKRHVTRAVVFFLRVYAGTQLKVVAGSN